MINPKHLATFLLGAAAGAAIMKYNSLSEEEKEKLMADLKAKADIVKNEAEEGFDKLKEYFEQLKTKGEEVMNEHISTSEDFVKDFFGQKNDEAKKA
jgi:predicted nucleotide-binding protein (sugar kinase/HSP70/actin superfamily)